MLTAAHLGPLTALRTLSLSEIALSLSAAAARAAWGQLQELDLTYMLGGAPPPLDRGFWQAVSDLRCLTQVRFIPRKATSELLSSFPLSVCGLGRCSARPSETPAVCGLPDRGEGEGLSS